MTDFFSTGTSAAPDVPVFDSRPYLPLSERQIAAIRDEFRSLEMGCEPVFPHITNHLRVIFSVAHWHQIPSAYFETVRAIIRSKADAVSQYHAVRHKFREWFRREVLSGGAPWTPSIQRKVLLDLKSQVILPPKVDWLAWAESQKQAGGES